MFWAREKGVVSFGTWDVIWKTERDLYHNMRVTEILHSRLQHTCNVGINREGCLSVEVTVPLPGPAQCPQG